MPDLLGLGEVMVEIYADQPLGTATTLQKSYGGDVLNALVMAQRLGCSTALCSHVGNDPFAAGLLAFCQAEGIATQHMPMVNGENGVYFISLQTGGEREFTYRRKGSAASCYSPANFDPTCLDGAKMLLLSGITQAISQSSQDATLAAAKAAKAQGVKVVYDPNYRPRLWAERGGLAAARAAYSQLEPFVDILVPSNPADLELFALNQAEPAMLIRQLLERANFELVALKSGEAGVWLGNSGLANLVPAKPTDVRDTTGAGDAWNGAFLSYILQGMPATQAAARANQMAAFKLQFRGAIPARTEFLAHIANS